MTTDDAGGLFHDLFNDAEQRFPFLNPTTNEVAMEAPPAALPDAEPGYLLLRPLLLALPIDERVLIIDGLDDAIRRGVLKAVPLEGPALSVNVPRAGRKRGRRLVRDHRLKDTPEAREWLARQRAEARYQRMEVTGRVSSTAERLDANLDNFDRLAELYRQTLKRKGKHGE